MEPSNAAKIINALGFQAIWWSVALWREASVPWVVIALVIYFFFYPCANKSTELKWVLLWTSLGVLMEFAFLKFSIIGYKDHSAFVPLWMVCLWVAFSATLNQSLSGLIQSKLLSFVLGAMGGPLSYWAAYRLEALYFPVSAERSVIGKQSASVVCDSKRFS